MATAKGQSPAPKQATAKSTAKKQSAAEAKNGAKSKAKEANTAPKKPAAGTATVLRTCDSCEVAIEGLVVEKISSLSKEHAMPRICPLLLLGTALTAVGCGDAAAPAADQPVVAPMFNVTDANPQAGKFMLCKLGSETDFNVDIVINTGTGSSTASWTGEHLYDDDCKVIYEDNEAPGDVVTVTEVVPDGYALDHVVLMTIDPSGVVTTTTLAGPTVSSEINGATAGAAAIYYNVPTPPDMAPGRMTGGGNQVRIDGVRITRGLTLHCDITLSNNLEINWSGGNQWHLDKPITSAICIDQPQINPVPPAAPFDTFIGEAVGRLNGVDGSLIRFTFVDDGEPGTTDEAHIMIWAPGDDPDTDSPVIAVSGTLDGGNLQAHYDQPHK